MTRRDREDDLDGGGTALGGNSIFGSADLDKSIFGKSAFGPDGLDSSVFGATAHDQSVFGNTVMDSSALLDGLFDESLPAATADPAEPVAILRVLLAGRPAHDIALVPGELTIGRHHGDLQLDDGTVSRRHLVLRVEPTRIVAIDLGSSQGTFVDGVRISRPTTLAIGTTFALGNQRLELRPLKKTAAWKQDLDVAALIAAPSPVDLEEAARASILFDLDDEERHVLFSATQRVDLEADRTLLAEGQLLEHLYIVLSGRLVLRRGGHSAGSLSKGDAVELLGVLHGGRTSFEIRSEEPVSLLRIDATKLREVVARDPNTTAYFERPQEWPGAARFRQMLRDYGVPREFAMELIAAMTLHVVPSGTTLGVEGQPVTAVRIVNRGTVTGAKMVEGAPALVAQLGEGGVFGAAELAADRNLGLTYETTTNSEILEISRGAVLDILERAPELGTLLEAFGPFGARPSGTPSRAAMPDAPDDDDPDAPPLAGFRKQGGTPPRRRARPVHVRQHDEMDCGAACLAMISKAYGRNISLATFRARVHVTREGASMWSLVKAARRTGFEVLGVQAQAKALGTLHLPAIALMKYHFVVVYKVDGKFALVGDPAIGMRRIPIEEFKKDFSGMLLLMRPTKLFFEQKASTPGWRKYFALAPGHVRAALEIILASLLLFVLGLGGPLLSQVTFDRVLVTADTGLLTIMTIAISVVAVVSALITAARAYLTGYIANRFDTVFSALVYRWIMRLPLNFFMVRRVGDILTRFREIVTVRQFITGDALGSLIQVTSIAIYVAVLWLYHPVLGALACVLVPLLTLTSVVCSKKLRRLMQEEFPAEAKAQGVMIEQLRALETVKTLGAEIAGRWRWEEAFRHGLKTRLRVDKLRVLITTVSIGIEQLAMTAMTYVAARMAVEGDLSVGKVIATGLFAASIFGPVRMLAGQWTNVQGVAVALGRIDDVLTTSPEPTVDAPARTSQRRLNGDIELRDVWFQYGSDLSPWVLKGVNLTIKRGETVAFVGRSGSGKTTLVQLLNLLYRPTRGQILLEGKDVSTLGLAQVRDSIGIVMQDSNLFAGTVFDNIAFGQENASIELVQAAARVANAHGFISSMKDGYFTKLKEGGAGLSGGQRQRINLARALFRRPTLLILDEATSALDAESERAVVNAMKIFCRGRTSILIAHRLSTILHADRIVLLDNGAVVETGSHRELIARGGAYAQLFGAQLAL